VQAAGRAWRGALAALLVVLASPAGAVVLLESAELGAVGRLGGASITANQFVGWRFELDVPLEVTEIGGHLFSNPNFSQGNGEIFGALVRLTSLDAFPLGDPFTQDEVVATVAFAPPFPSDQILVPLAAELEPGSYALVFGSQLFGATGEGGLPNLDDQPDIPPTTIDSYIFYGIPGPSQPPVWRGPLASHMRFLVRGVPEPPADASALAGVAALLALALQSSRR